MQNLASIQPRTSLVKFARSPCTDRPGDGKQLAPAVQHTTAARVRTVLWAGGRGFRPRSQELGEVEAVAWRQGRQPEFVQLHASLPLLPSGRERLAVAAEVGTVPYDPRPSDFAGVRCWISFVRPGCAKWPLERVRHGAGRRSFYWVLCYVCSNSILERFFPFLPLFYQTRSNVWRMFPC